LERRLITWRLSSGEAWLDFYILGSAVFGALVSHAAPGAKNAWMVIPGSRATLVLAKLRMNPVLANLLEGKWKFLKFRHVHNLSENQALTADNILEALEQDPITRQDSQMSLL
jgi:hypothetical protein